MLTTKMEAEKRMSARGVEQFETVRLTVLLDESPKLLEVKFLVSTSGTHFE